MLGRRELRLWVDRFGASEMQVRRDHFISHVLFALPALAPHATFFGGTALCRTYLPDWRLSEDVDLLVDDPAAVRRDIEGELAGRLSREFPRLETTWMRETGALRAGDVSLRLQLVMRDAGYRRYPTARTSVNLRYDDLPATIAMTCPTRIGFAAMKLTAWADRRSPRDLVDLYGLARARGLTRRALSVASEASRPVQLADYADVRAPTEDAWTAALGHQMRNPPQPHEALRKLRQALEALIA